MFASRDAVARQALLERLALQALGVLADGRGAAGHRRAAWLRHVGQRRSRLAGPTCKANRCRSRAEKPRRGGRGRRRGQLGATGVDDGRRCDRGCIGTMRAMVWVRDRQSEDELEDRDRRRPKATRSPRLHARSIRSRPSRPSVPSPRAPNPSRSKRSQPAAAACCRRRRRNQG
jgi:hypothetical protein